jgi:hypothetical protein
LLVLAFVSGLLLGATVFLIAAKRFVAADVLRPYYVQPGVPIASWLSARLFDWAYRRSKDGAG